MLEKRFHHWQLRLLTTVSCPRRNPTNRWTGATGSEFRIKRDPAKLFGSAVARSTQPLYGGTLRLIQVSFRLMNLTQYLRGLSPLDIYFARLIAATAAACEIWYVVERQYQMYKVFKAGSEVDFDPRYMQMHLRITVALLHSAVCLWSRRA